MCHRQPMLGARAVDDVEAVPHRSFGRQRRDHDLIRVERVNCLGQGPQRSLITQRTVGVEVLRAQRGQGVVQPLPGRPAGWPPTHRAARGSPRLRSRSDWPARRRSRWRRVSAPMRRSSSRSSSELAVSLAITSTRRGFSVGATPSASGRRLMNHLLAKYNTSTTAHDNRLRISCDRMSVLTGPSAAGSPQSPRRSGSTTPGTATSSPAVPSPGCGAAARSARCRSAGRRTG